MSPQPSITYWNRLEPSPRADSLRRGLEAAVRDPLWFLSRQWQVGEFQGEDAASPAFVSFAARFTAVDGWAPDSGAPRPFDGSAPLEPLSQNEATTPDLRTAVELGQALEARLATSGAGPGVVEAFRDAFPVPRVADLGPAERRDRALVRLVRVCGGRATHGLDALAAAARAAPGLPAEAAPRRCRGAGGRRARLAAGLQPRRPRPDRGRRRGGLASGAARLRPGGGVEHPGR